MQPVDEVYRPVDTTPTLRMAQRLRLLALDMKLAAKDMLAHGAGKQPWTDHAYELLGAAALVQEWAGEIGGKDDV